MHFVCTPLAPSTTYVLSNALDRGEPPVPDHFDYADATLRVARVVRSWRSTNTDRGDTYLARHWYEFALADGRQAVVYFDRKAKPGRPRWWLYTLSDVASDADADATGIDVASLKPAYYRRKTSPGV